MKHIKDALMFLLCIGVILSVWAIYTIGTGAYTPQWMDGVIIATAALIVLSGIITVVARVEALRGAIKHRAVNYRGNHKDSHRRGYITPDAIIRAAERN